VKGGFGRFRCARVRRLNHAPRVTDPAVQSKPASKPAGALLAPLAITLILCLAAAARPYLVLTTHATEEDFFISLRYARNLAAGEGFVYNPGSHVLGATSPLYILILAGFFLAHLSPVLWGKLAGIGADLISCWAAWRICGGYRKPVAGLAAALLVAFAPTNLLWSAKGMEVELVAAAAAVAWMWWLQGREVAAWIAAAVLVLLRIDGLATPLIMAAGSAAFKRRVSIRAVGLFTLILLPWLVFSTAYFGSPAPVSIRAKLIVYAWSFSRSPFPNLGSFVVDMTHNPLSALIAIGALFCVAICISAIAGARPGEAGFHDYRLLAPPICWLAVYYGSMAFSKVFLFGWYFVPPTPVYYAVSALGWSAAFQLAARWRPIQSIAESGLSPSVASALILVAALPPAAAAIRRVRSDLVRAQHGEDALRIRIGTWLLHHARPGDTVMLEPIGYAGYISRLKVLDTVGLVSPEVLKYYRRGGIHPYHWMWSRYRPEWILLRAQELVDLRRSELALPPSERLEASYQKAAEFASNGAPAGSPPAFTLFRERRRT
ncbi:MAG TPA: hypothetical protein VGS41_03110, partial [Chthonomonadales bacterium]|nr:hypothetical protein [Chthonomonadales bacterium]